MTTPSTIVTLPNPERPVDREAIAQAIEALAATVGAARARVEAGDLIDLAGLDDRVGSICAGISGLDGTAARALLPQLMKLTGALDTLEELLKRQPRRADDLPEARRRVEAASAPARAADAYRTAGREP
jgi:hypothetical protein